MIGWKVVKQQVCRASYRSMGFLKKPSLKDTKQQVCMEELMWGLDQLLTALLRERTWRFKESLIEDKVHCNLESGINSLFWIGI